MKWRWYLILGLLTFASTGKAQILHTEYFNVILDTTKIVQGTFLPSMRYRNLKEVFIEIENTSDISMRFGKNGITVGNKLEFERFGKQNLISSGFIYLEYQRVTKRRKVALEPYALMLWQEVRGLNVKYASGVNGRWQVVYQKDMGLFLGIGSQYEFERWNYLGTSDSTLIPADASPIEASIVRGNAYISFKKNFGEKFRLDLSGYYQPRFDKPFVNYRLASSTTITYNLSESIGLTMLYQNIYDPKPIVPIDKLYHDITVGLTLSFN